MCAVRPYPGSEAGFNFNAAFPRVAPKVYAPSHIHSHNDKIPDGPESVYILEAPFSARPESWLVVARGASARLRLVAPSGMCNTKHY